MVTTLQMYHKTQQLSKQNNVWGFFVTFADDEPKAVEICSGIMHMVSEISDFLPYQ